MKHLMSRNCSRRDFIAAGFAAASTLSSSRLLADTPSPSPKSTSPFATRGVVVMASDLSSWPWVERAAQTGLTTIGLHGSSGDNIAFLMSEPGQAFVRECAANTIAIEHEFHAANQLLPRDLFEKDATLFRMNDAGERTPDTNLCVSSPRALEIASENAVRFARDLPSTTGRYYFWSDDGQPMCRCPKCKGLSDSDQTLLLENTLLNAVKQVRANATLAHLCYHRTLPPPTQVKPEPGVFLEFAPIGRDSTRSMGDPTFAPHAALLEQLASNLALFGSATAQVLEYWLDVSRFSGWKRETLTKIPWNRDVFQDDLRTYAKLGVRHITTFACWIDGEYVKRFGNPPLDEYGEGLLSVSKD